MSTKEGRRLNANRRASIQHLIREIESELGQFRDMIDRREAAASDPTIEYWLMMIRDHFKHLF